MTRNKVKLIQRIATVLSIIGLLIMVSCGMMKIQTSLINWISLVTFLSIVSVAQTEKFLNKSGNG